MTYSDKDKSEKSASGQHKPQGEGGREAGVAGAGRQDSGNDEQIPEISAEIHEQVLNERNEYLESLQRLQAEFTNFRKRVIKESEQASRRASKGVLEELLPVLDNFDRALSAAAEHDEKLLSEGVEMVYKQLQDVMMKHGFCEVEAAGEQFDPTHHEAVLCRPSRDNKEGTVIEVLEKGYKVGDQVVRPAKVVVSGGDED